MLRAAGFSAAAVLSAALFTAPATAQDLSFTLSNSTSYTVMEFYASPTDVADWEEDILGSDVLGAGESATVTIADGRSQCEYDLRYVFDDGTELTDQADLCSMGSYTITE
jgi:hypothetical protein